MVALKVLTPQGEARDDLLYRFRAETDLVSRLGGQHHLVAGRFAAPALVLELGEGSLAGRLTRGVLPLKIAQIVARQLLDAVVWLHQNGVIHRDIKPSNILMIDDGTIRLGDLGVAASGDPPRGLPDGWIEEEIGTLGYAAPELLRNPGLATPSVDIYSVGVVCYEMVSGVLPFSLAPEETEPAFRERLMAGPTPRPLVEATPEVSANYAAIVMAAIDPDPERRPQSAAELALAVSRAT